MNKTQKQVIENLKKQIAERKTKLSIYGYEKAIQTVADQIIPDISDKIIQPAIIPTEF